MTEQILSAVPYYYSASKQSPNTVRLILELQDEVEEELLRVAVGEAMVRYPYFKVRAAVENEELCLVENEADVTVQNREKPILLGSEEANGYLLAFSWWENRIYLDFFHGLADGAGILPLLRTMMYYYCRKRYDSSLSREGVRLAGEVIPLEEIEDPYPASVDDGIQPIGKAKRKRALNLAETGLCTPGTPTRYTIKIPEKALMGYCRGREGSPAAVIGLLMARAVDFVHPNASLPIICGMAMNIRGVLNKPLAHHSLVSQLFLEYRDGIKSMPLEEQVTCFRGMILLQSQKENVLDSVRNNLKLAARLKELPDLASRRFMMQKAVSASMGADTFKVSYVGKCGMGAAERYTKTMGTMIDLNGSGIMIEVNAVNGWFFLEFMQEWEEDVYVNAFCRQLEAEYIGYELADKGPLQVAPIVFAGS